MIDFFKCGNFVNAVIGRKYRIVRKIGSGAFGQIFLGIEIGTDNEVAIKVEPIRGKGVKFHKKFTNFLRSTKFLVDFFRLSFSMKNGIYLLAHLVSNSDHFKTKDLKTCQISFSADDLVVTTL